MGAFGAKFCFPGRLTHEQVTRKFKKEVKFAYMAQLQDYAQDGWGEPYGGGYSRLSYIEFEDIFIKDYNKAVEYCAQRADKWSGRCCAVLTNYKPHGRKKASKHWLVFGWVPE